MQHSLIQELMLYEFGLNLNDTEVMKNICIKSEDAVDHSTVIRRLKKFCLGSKNPNIQRESDKPKIPVSKAMLQTIEGKLVSSIQRVSGELGISQSSVVHHLHDFGKSIWNC